MDDPRIITIGDNVCDKYLSRGRMYPGGQCVNISVFSRMNGADTAYLGKFGDDDVARCVIDALAETGVDASHCRRYEGENGFACVTLDGNDRVFLGSNKGGIAKEHAFDFSPDDFDYIKSFDLICTNLSSYIEDDLEVLAETGMPVAFDFSTRWTGEYLEQICPYTTVAVLSCAHLSDSAREQEMSKVASFGVPLVLGTVGENGSWLLHKNKYLYAEATLNENAIDTMGAGDAYFSAFITSVLKQIPRGIGFDNIPNSNQVFSKAMRDGAVFSANVCGLEGAFGHGIPIAGRIIDRPNL